VQNNKADDTTSIVEADLISAKTEESDFCKTLQELFSKSNLTQKSELSLSEINKLAVLYAIARKYHFDELKDILDAFLELRVSTERKGRKEIVEIAKGKLYEEVEDKVREMQKVKKI